MKSELVLKFGEIVKEDVETAGGKGANLGEMTSAKIPVPNGVVLTSDAYDAYMEHNGIDPYSYEDNGALRKIIVNGIFPGTLKDEIIKAYKGLNSPVAVRSSATAEDLSDASFAGQQETYLNVSGEEALLEAVRKCYASLWGDRAISYRKNTGYDTGRVRLAVVIQEMVRSDFSGVMFTSDPSGDAGNVHINASYGLGEAIVSGIVSPDEYITDKEGNILREHIGSKEVRIVYSGSGTNKEEVPKELRNKRVMTDDQIFRLVKEGMRIENHYGHPMDIEWAFADDKIYILQARSITTLGGEREKIYTDEDFVGLPKVKPAKGSFREGVLFNLEKTPTPYFPLDHDYGGNVGYQKEVLFNEIGINFTDGLYPIDEDGISRINSNKMKITRNIFNVPKYLKRINDSEANMKNADASLLECTRRFEKEKEGSYKSVKELGSALKRMRDLVGKTAYDRFLYALFPNAVTGSRVNKILKKVDKDLNSYDILEGLSYVTADINRRLVKISGFVNEDKAMADYVDTHSYEEICAKYPELGRMLSEFMDEFGSKSDYNCYCFISRTWREDKDRFICVLRPMIKSGGGSVPTEEESRKKYEDLMSRVKNTISSKKYREFEKQVTALRHYHYIREASQYLWESEFELCRRLLRELSDAVGISYEDLLYLFSDELYEMCDSGDTSSALKIIEKRKEKRPLAKAYWNKCMEDALATNDGQIKGIGGAIGQSSGPVCLITSPAEFGKLSKGDILVCTYTDPEWTPLFTLAAGVVVDTGGTLSHAAIVAREYGIPAVLATGDATKKLKDKDMVMVDGTNGRVTVLT
ncbi:MAG: phosphoenolpyruvate synthase [Lachnospiraceae bacterium]|nr:phosphoenolpyruvate synthase [Lachnospiraceae bacterium]